MKYVVLIILVSKMAFAQMKSSLYKKPEAVPTVENSKKSLTTTISKMKHAAKIEVGNLPNYYLKRNQYVSEVNPIILPSKAQMISNNQLLSGEVVRADIQESLIAFSESKAPIRAIITSGKLKGSILIGEATLEKNSKRILIQFNKLRTVSINNLWTVSAQALDYKGILGIEGDYVSGEEKYFGAEFLAAAAAGFTDATVERTPTPLGGTIEKPGTDTYSKKALASALSKTAERFSEKVKASPEYSVLQGPFEIQVLILDQPKLTE